MAGLKPPRVPGKPVPVFAAGDPPRLERACAGRAFAQRRAAALIAVFRATGIRLSELAGIRYDPGDPGRSDVDLRHREITVQGRGRKTRTVKISSDAARNLDRYLRVRARHAQAYRPQMWLGAGNRGPMTASRITRSSSGAAASAASTCTRTGSGTTSATPGSTGAVPRATSWSSTAGPPRRSSAATAPAPRRPHLPMQVSGCCLRTHLCTAVHNLP
jgi:integrase